MTSAIRFHDYGGPEVLKWEPVTVGEPGPGEVRIRHSAVGLNFIDVYFRSGHYKVPSLPSGLGSEGAGVVEAIGPDVTDVKPGDRVAYAMGPQGAYSEARIIPAKFLVKLPAGIDDRTAAAIMLQGLTTQYLLRRTYPVKKGETILIHAAAGGVGLLVCQWARHLGVTVIGTVSTEEKGALAKANGCDHVIYYTRENVAERVRTLTDGVGVPVVYDSVGKDTFDASLDCLKPFGMMVLFGASSGKVPPFDVSTLAPKGSLFLTRPTLATHVAKREDLLANSAELFDVVMSGAVKVSINQTVALKDAGEAHRALEARETTGSTVLVP